MRNAFWPAAALLLAAFALALSGGATRQHALAAPTLVVTKVDDTNDGSCTPQDCSLREALAVVQSQDVIGFAIPGTGIHTIEIDPGLGALPAILQANHSVTIDGYSQSQAQVNTAGQWQPGNAVIKIVIDGHLLSSGSATGLWIGADNATVRGLSIVNFKDEGIKVATFAPSATIVGNYLGVLPDGHTPGPNGVGVLVRSSEAGNSIGGADPAKRNLISGNTGPGISVTGGYAVAIAGNFIGTDVTGMQALPNGANGIDMAGGPNSQIGGDLTYGGNLISGNAVNGIAISTDDGKDMEVRGNYIGVAANGETPMPNGHDGVYLSQNAANNTIGGEVNAGEKNIIAHNAAAGVGIASSAGPDNYIDPNFMYANVGMGVDINDDGLVLPNDYGDATCNNGAIPAHCPDADGGTDGLAPDGPNRLMNYPIITNATYVGSTLHFDGTLDTFPGPHYNMFFFWNDTCDPSGNGEGRYFLGSLGFPGPDAPNFDRTFNVSMAGDVYLTMSASDPESSSEFSPCYLIHTGIPVTPSPTPPAQPKQGDMNCDDEFTLTDVTQFLHYLATGERGPAPDGCPGVGASIGDDMFLDADCDGSVTPRDLLVMLIHLSGANQLDLPTGCPQVGERI